MFAENGMWLSLVERCVRDAKAAGSNPVIPTSINNQPIEISTFQWVFSCPLFYVILWDSMPFSPRLLLKKC